MPVAGGSTGSIAGPWQDADLDLNFSPSTNLIPLRRLGLAVGAEAPVRAAGPDAASGVPELWGTVPSVGAGPPARSALT